METQSNVLELIDENGTVTRFEHLLTLDYDGSEYIVITPLEPIDGIEEDAVVILRLEQDENGDDIFVPIEDEEELHEVYEAFVQFVEEAEDDVEN
jgi:uncharacterized protein YrzB (UPF0473 family)